MISTLGKRRGGDREREREPDKRVERDGVLGWAVDCRCVWRERGSARGEQ